MSCFVYEKPPPGAPGQVVRGLETTTFLDQVNFILYTLLRNIGITKECEHRKLEVGDYVSKLINKEGFRMKFWFGLFVEYLQKNCILLQYWNKKLLNFLFLEHADILFDQVIRELNRRCNQSNQPIVGSIDGLSVVLIFCRPSIFDISAIILDQSGKKSTKKFTDIEELTKELTEQELTKHYCIKLCDAHLDFFDHNCQFYAEIVPTSPSQKTVPEHLRKPILVQVSALDFIFALKRAAAVPEVAQVVTPQVAVPELDDDPKAAIPAKDA